MLFIRPANVIELNAETFRRITQITADRNKAFEILIVKTNNRFAHYTPTSLMFDRRFYTHPRLCSRGSRVRFGLDLLAIAANPPHTKAMMRRPKLEFVRHLILQVF